MRARTSNEFRKGSLWVYMYTFNVALHSIKSYTSRHTIALNNKEISHKIVI